MSNEQVAMQCQQVKEGMRFYHEFAHFRYVVNDALISVSDTVALP